MKKRGAIKIIYKKGEISDLKNYRPITLLNVDLKIITRALYKRLAKVIPNIIHHNQKCLPGRHITDNIHTMQDLIDLLNKNNENGAVLLFDQEKAFDRMSHAFIIKTLKAFGFGEYFTKWIKIIYKDTKSFVKVNGYETAEFDIQRGVKQGCPLSSILYVLVAEVLALEMRNNADIKGFRYSNGEFKISQYADDIAMIVVNIESIKEIIKVFSKYEKATNAKINQSKTECLWVGAWKNRTDKPEGWNWSNDMINLLGVYIGNRTNKKQYLSLCNSNFDDIRDKIHTKINYWKGSGLSLKGKIQVTNIFILSKLWYRLECADISGNTKDDIERQTMNFIWNDRKFGRISKNTLCLNYNQGGLKLQDIGIKIRTLRIKWLSHVLTLPENKLERYLVDNIIGNFRDIKGLKILHHNIAINVFGTFSMFYQNAIQMWKSLDINHNARNLINIYNEIIYKNPLLTNDQNETFNFPDIRIKKKYFPTTIK